MTSWIPPWIGFLAESLRNAPEIFDGDHVVCDRCPDGHKAIGMLGNDTILHYTVCLDGKETLVGIHGKCIVGLKPDVSSSDRSHVHEMCNDCWGKRNPERRPVRLKDHSGRCCWCGGVASGIVVLDLAKELTCIHEGEKTDGR